MDHGRAIASFLRPEPAGTAAGAEFAFLGRARFGGSVEGSLWWRSAGDVDVDTADSTAAELDVAGSRAAIWLRWRVAARLGDQPGGDGCSGALRERTRLRHPRRRAVAE